MHNQSDIEKIIGYKFKDKTLLEGAFIHSSFANEHRVKSNERLEFLGDSVLSIIVTDYIYHHFKKNEGDLSKIRASLVSEKTLSAVMEVLDIGKNLQTGRGIKSNPTNAMLADAFEALVAAIYLDGGLDSAKSFVLGVLQGAMSDIVLGGVPQDNKSALQEKFPNAKIVYKTVAEGEGLEKIYISRVLVNGVMSGEGKSTKKRVAEEIAAGQALKTIKKV